MENAPFEIDDAREALETGSFAAFARTNVGASVARFDPWRAHGSVLGLDLARQAVLVLADELPRLSARETARERLRDRLWLLDFEIENEGLVPTLAREARAEREASAWITVSGARVVTAVARGEGRAQADLRRRGADWFVGHLDGGERVGVRLVVEGEVGSTLTFSCASIRGTSSALEIELR